MDEENEDEVDVEDDDGPPPHDPAPHGPLMGLPSALQMSAGTLFMQADPKQHAPTLDDEEDEEEERDEDELLLGGGGLLLEADERLLLELSDETQVPPATGPQPGPGLPGVVMSQMRPGEHGTFHGETIPALQHSMSPQNPPRPASDGPHSQ